MRSLGLSQPERNKVVLDFTRTIIFFDQSGEIQLAMKLEVLQQDLLPAIQSVSRSVGVKSTLPVLGNILLATESSRLKIAATNLEIGVIKLISAKITEDGEITIPAKIISDLIASLPATTITIETNGDLVKITANKFSAEINGIPASEFPVIPTSTEDSVSFKRQILKDYARVMFAASGDGGRPVLTAILTSAHLGKLDLVATDGFRLAHQQVILPEQKVSFKSLIPKKTLEEVLRIIDEDSADEVLLSTSANQNQIIFNIGKTIVSSRLIEGNFPAWEKIIPTEYKTRIIIDRVSLAQAIKLASVFAKTEANVITFDISQEVIVSSETKELGAQTNELDCQIEGEPLKIAFSAKFLADAVSASDAASLMIEFSTPLSPALIKPIGIEGLEYIVMPVRQS